MERYQKLAAEKGIEMTPAAPEAGPMNLAAQKRQEAIERRKAARKK
jgi:hypothetical protein